MYEAVYIAATGIKQQQTRMDTIANNIANVNSAAYKSERVDFKDALYTAGYIPGLPRTPEPDGNQQKGHGVMIAGITKDYRTGSLQTTERQLDVAIEGEGFFELEDIDGNLVYSRNGAFAMGQFEDRYYLTNSDGYFVHDANGERIQFPEGTGSIAIANDGRITFVYGEEEAYASLGIYTFGNLTGLLSVGSGNYAESEASGEKIAVNDVKLWQGMLEMSNVSLSEEMTRIIRTQRVFQLASRALRTADDMEGIANNLRK